MCCCFFVLVKMYMGDDFNFFEMIEGDVYGYLYVFFGIFDVIVLVVLSVLVVFLDGNVEEFW